LRTSSLLRLLANFESRLSQISPTIDFRYQDEASACEEDFHTFLRAAWHVIEGDRPFIDGWHIQAECEHYEALFYGNILKLIINVPPGTCKSTIGSVAFPAWVWTKTPSSQFLYASYGMTLAVRDSVAWGNKCQLTRDINTKTRFANAQAGYRIATSIGGTTTGEHVDYEFFDDPNNTANVESEVIRTDTNIKFDRVFSGRFNDPKTGRLCVVQQRTHFQDLSGHILSKNIPGLIHLCLPQEYEVSRQCTTIPLKSTKGEKWEDPRKEEGQLLWPEFFDKKSVELGKIDLGGEYAIAGQYQQRPSPGQGGIFKKKDFQWWKQKYPPRCHFVLQSWDTAFSKSATASWSACTTWGIFKNDHQVDNIILLSLWRGRLENPDVRRMILRLAHNYYDTHTNYPAPETQAFKPDMILIEGKANGTPLLQDLRRAGLIINSFDPLKHGGGDKTSRGRAISHLVEAGLIWIPSEPPLYTKLRPFADLFVESCASFPNDDDSKDIVDTMSQALIKFRLQGLIGHPDDAYIQEEFNPNRGKRIY